MQILYKSADRGLSRTGWLESRHSFSFGSWYRPDRRGFRALRVLNDDRVAPGAGFGAHPHRDMEILTFVLAGALEHRDSSGVRSLLHAGDVARMSAGSGVVHSEWNASTSEPLHFLQVWLRPARLGIDPGHERRQGLLPVDASTPAGLRLVASPTGEGSALTLQQDAHVYAGRTGPDAPVRLTLEAGRGAWVQAVGGGLVANGTRLSPGDGLSLEDETELVWAGDPEGDFLIFDLA